MGNLLLCSQCILRFKKGGALQPAPNDGECHICRGALSSAQALVASALRQSQEFEWHSFSVSSSFPKQALVREQDAAERLQPGESTSLKNQANAALISAISLATGKESSQRAPDAAFRFDFSSGAASAAPAPLYVFGRYLKLSRGHCQSRWHCSECRGRGCESCGGSGRNYPSVEDELGKALSSAFHAPDYALHASGREDVNVRMLGSGRPFVMELRGAKKRNADLRGLESLLSQNPAVQAIGLRAVGRHFLDAVCNSHFEKEYSAVVSASRPLSAADAEKIESLSGAAILQQTPTRVLSRRADLVRKRKVFSVDAKQCGGGHLRLRILAEAGTYIKELISSDGGRTKPSVSGLLGCDAVCDELDVFSIHDYFLQTIRD